jgi:hypothetical protein
MVRTPTNNQTNPVGDSELFGFAISMLPFEPETVMHHPSVTFKLMIC